jgi:hypothetical protein
MKFLSLRLVCYKDQVRSINSPVLTCIVILAVLKLKFISYLASNCIQYCYTFCHLLLMMKFFPDTCAWLEDGIVSLLQSAQCYGTHTRSSRTVVSLNASLILST